MCTIASNHDHQNYRSKLSKTKVIVVIVNNINQVATTTTTTATNNKIGTLNNLESSQYCGSIKKFHTNENEERSMIRYSNH